ncbi:hypothetical protein MNBD_PLANCTO03-1487 [hydrothermal vent metagenome]|uniref:SSU ribosomal protein S6p n=1 Tax=hydrothermal vent metagenome TaxID=652676 RepID=A0A3B1DJN3_9ZZZZ
MATSTPAGAQRKKILSCPREAGAAHRKVYVMSENTKVYESMFLINQAEAADLQGAVAHIEEILCRGDAEVVSMRKWDERRLAFEIDKQRRGVFILCYFRSPTNTIAHIERDCTLSERIMRVMIMTADHLSEEEIAAQDDRVGLVNEAKLRAEKAATEAERAAPVAVVTAEAAPAEAAPAEAALAPEAAPVATAEAAPEAAEESTPTE